MKRRRGLILSIILAFLPVVASAQFVLSSTDDAALKWRSISSDNFEVIYPFGCDSLARVYLRELETNRPRVASSVGMAANEGRRKPLPVVLHVQNASSNGLVTWTPRRMELNTLPEWGNPSPMPWTTMLSIHEGRHAAQMANGYRKVFKPFYYAFGQIIPGMAAGWPGSLFLEGDAVVAETALSRSGRGRSASFLMYYNYAFDNGDWRNWMRWRLGSYYKYTPDHYAFGYTLLSGVRTRYDAPLFMSDYFDYVSRRPYDPWPFRHALRRTSGKKFKESYPEILTANYDGWVADTASRKPFMPVTVLSSPSSRLTYYSNSNSTPDEKYLWIKKDLYHNSAMTVMEKDGREKKLFPISDNTGIVKSSRGDSTLLWNEIRRDPRWGQKRHSIVRSYSFATGRTRNITTRGNYVSPVSLEDGRIAAIRYMENGRESVDMLDSGTGEVIVHVPVPDSLQILEITQVRHCLYAVGISKGGSGIYGCRRSVTGSFIWETVLQPHPFSVYATRSDGDAIVFESDRTGVNEFYRYDTVSGVLTQITSTLYGATGYNLCPDGSVTYSLVCGNGSCAALTHARELPNKVVDWNDYHRYSVADKLSEQEAALAARGDSLAGAGGLAGDYTRAVAKHGGNVMSKRYRKVGSGVQLHSWAPLYADMDAITAMSFDNVKNMAHLGAMAFFQNDMSTFYGYFGYQAKLVENGYGDGGGNWRNVGHVNLTYSGIYPEFNAELHINEDAAKEYWYDETDGKTYYRNRNEPRVRTNLTVRVPLSWDNGVLQYGVIPYAGVGYTNDTVYGNANILYKAGARAYVVQHTPSACIYPKLGIGAEFTLSESAAWAYLYAYVPGIGWGQGLKLSAVGQKPLRDRVIYASSYVSLLPRGYAKLSAGILEGIKATADYAAPFPMGDWHIADAFYCKRGIFTPHFDYSALRCSNFDIPYFSREIGGEWGNMWSAGFTFELEFGSFFWVRTPISVGLTYSYNGGNLFEHLALPSDYRNYVGATFSMSL